MARKKPMKYEECHRDVDGIDHKLCNICLEWKPCNEEHFYKNKSNGMDGYNTYCKPCTVKKTRQYNIDNPEQYKEGLRKKDIKRLTEKKDELRALSKRRRENGKYIAWQRENKDKIKEYNRKYSNKKHKISSKEWANCKLYFNNECAYCGMTEEEHRTQFKTDLHKEHAVNNGANDLSNCVPSCMECNSEKHYYDYTEWYTDDNPKFNSERFQKIIDWFAFDYKKYIKQPKV